MQERLRAFLTDGSSKFRNFRSTICKIACTALTDMSAHAMTTSHNKVQRASWSQKNTNKYVCINNQLQLGGQAQR